MLADGMALEQVHRPSIMRTREMCCAGQDGHVQHISMTSTWECVSGRLDFAKAITRKGSFGDIVQLLWCDTAQARVAGCSTTAAVAVWDATK